MYNEIYGNYTLSQMSKEELRELRDKLKRDIETVEYFLMKKELIETGKICKLKCAIKDSDIKGGKPELLTKPCGADFYCYDRLYLQCMKKGFSTSATVIENSMNKEKPKNE